MYNRFKKAATKAFVNHGGKRTKKKWVVFESDDWGSIRTSSKKSFNNLKKKGYPVDLCPFNTYDSLESNSDLENLFDTLYSVKGADGSPAKFTLDTVVSNPDFSKVKDSGYREMHTETFFQTAEKYPNHDRVEELYKEGITEGIIKPQFHGLQHIHANNWLNALASGETAVLDAFEEEMITVHQHNKTRCSEFYLDAWAMHTNQDIKNISEELTEGLKLFQGLFGFLSVSAIPPCFKMTEDVLAVLSENGVNHIQAALYQQSIDDSSRKRHYTGEKNRFGQFYTVRNVNFEPSLTPNKDWISEVLQDVYWAFFWGKPAIINTHRLNFIGSLSEKNRDQNLKLLKEILKKITKRWPEVEFVTSDRLGEVFA